MRLSGALQAQRRLSLTSLIDVIFLLLLFFMLSSTFTKFAEIEIVNSGSRAGALPSLEEPVFVSLKPDQILVNGVDTGFAELTTAIRASAPSERPTVLISVTNAVTSQRLVDVLNSFRDQSFAVRFLNSGRALSD
jgi:biopolymer transport protein ExbD